MGEGGFINGGFFILNPSVLERISGDDCIWEDAPLRSLAKDSELFAFKHQGFWRPMDTLRDKNYLEELWNTKRASWKKWNDNDE